MAEQSENEQATPSDGRNWDEYPAQQGTGFACWRRRKLYQIERFGEIYLITTRSAKWISRILLDGDCDAAKSACEQHMISRTWVAEATVLY